jgi:hypothetical protein
VNGDPPGQGEHEGKLVGTMEFETPAANTGGGNVLSSACLHSEPPNQACRNEASRSIRTSQRGTRGRCNWRVVDRLRSKLLRRRLVTPGSVVVFINVSHDLDRTDTNSLNLQQLI